MYKCLFCGTDLTELVKIGSDEIELLHDIGYLHKSCRHKYIDHINEGIEEMCKISNEDPDKYKIKQN